MSNLKLNEYIEYVKLIEDTKKSALKFKSNFSKLEKLVNDKDSMSKKLTPRQGEKIQRLSMELQEILNTFTTNV